MSVAAARDGSRSDLAALGHVASAQYGLIRAEQLRALGLPPSLISKWVARGLVHRRYPRVYVIGHTALSRDGELLAAVFAGGTGALLSRLAATELWELRRRRHSVIDVVVPRFHRPLPGIRFHETRALHPADVASFKGIPVTSVARTLVDLSDLLHPLELANVIHEAAFRGRFDLTATRAAIARATGRHNLTVLEQAIAHHLGGSAGFRSGAEARFFGLVQAADLPVPLVNAALDGLEVDFRWPEAKLAVEVDGAGHRRARTRREDAAVDLALRAAGYTVLRFTDADLAWRPDHVVQAVAAGLFGA